MPNYIPRLARFSAGKKAPTESAPPDPHTRERAVNVDRLARLAPRIRRSLSISRQFSDDALLASLVAIARHPSHEARWHAAETSTLGQYLASNSKDMHRSLVALLSLLPQPSP